MVASNSWRLRGNCCYFLAAFGSWCLLLEASSLVSSNRGVRGDEGDRLRMRHSNQWSGVQSYVIVLLLTILLLTWYWMLKKLPSNVDGPRKMTRTLSIVLA